MRVLFVCTNNFCRSPMAAAIFSAMLRGAWLEALVTGDSAGLSSHYVGEPAHPGTLRVLSQHHIPCEHRARQLTKKDVNTFDYILAMDERNVCDIHFLYGAGRAKVRRLLEYAPHATALNVPDPYFTGDFEVAYTTIHQGVTGFFEHLQRELR